MTTDPRPFDCDNHYYETGDAFTRHVDPAMQPRVVQWADIDGRRRHVVGGRVNHAVANPTWDPVAKPGALRDYFRGNTQGRSPLDALKDREPLPAAYVDRDARLAAIEAQGLQGVWLLPTLGVLYEEELKHDLPAVVALMRGFNRWLDDDWGFAHEDTIFAAPYISLADPDAAVDELQWALDRDAHCVVMRPAAVWTEHGPRSPANPMFDRFWSLLDEAGIPLIIHASDSGYSSQGYADDTFSTFGPGSGRQVPSIKAFSIERAAGDFLMTLSLEKMYERFPNLRIASIENGSGFLHDIFRKLPQQRDKLMGWFGEDPVDLFREHVWINPFWEDDVAEVLDHMGPERVIFGSDWPHIEGLPEPLDYLDELADVDDVTRQRIMRDNVLALNTPRTR